MTGSSITLADTGSKIEILESVFDSNRVDVIVDFNSNYLRVHVSDDIVGILCKLSADFYNNSVTFIARIINFKTVSFEDCNFRGNQANTLIYGSRFSKVQVINSTIEGNDVVLFSDITDDARATFQDVIFAANTVSAGLSQGVRSTATYERCQFTGHVDYSSLLSIGMSSVANITDCSFVGNNAGNFDGNIIKVFGRAHANMVRITVRDNVNIYTCDFREYATVNMYTASFKGNTAVDTGSGLRASGNSHVSLTSVLFQNNTANGAGGTIRAHAYSKIDADNCTFLGNFGVSGGAILASSWSSVSVMSGYFEDNTASDGGGIYARDDALVTFVSSTFRGNRARSGKTSVGDGFGGAARLQHRAIMIVDAVVFEENKSDKDGGAICVDGSASLVTSGCVFFKNEALGMKGGAIYSSGHNSLQLNGSVFQRNRGAFGGGALSVYALKTDDVTCDECVFHGNNAHQGPLFYANNPRVIPAFIQSMIELAADDLSHDLSSSPLFFRLTNAPPSVVYSGETGGQLSFDILDGFGRPTTSSEGSPSLLRLSVAPMLGGYGRARVFGDTVLTVIESHATLSFGLIGDPGEYIVTLSGDGPAAVAGATTIAMRITACPKGMTASYETGLSICVADINVDVCKLHQQNGTLLLESPVTPQRYKTSAIVVISVLSVMLAAEVFSVPHFTSRFARVVRRVQHAANRNLPSAKWNTPNLVRLLFLGLQVLQMHAIVLDADVRSPLVDTSSNVFSSAGLSSFSASFSWYFWVIMSITTLWIAYAAIFIVNGGVKFRTTLAGRAFLFPADYLLQAWVTAGFIPTMLNGMRAFHCRYLPDAAYMAVDGVCSVQCWESTHWAYVVVGAIEMLVFYPLASISSMMWQDLDTTLDVRFRPQFFIVDPILKLFLVILRVFFTEKPIPFLSLVFAINAGYAVYTWHKSPCYVTWVNTVTICAHISAATTSLLLLAASASGVIDVVFAVPAVWVAAVIAMGVFLRWFYPATLFVRLGVTNVKQGRARQLFMSMKGVLRGHSSVTGVSSNISLASLGDPDATPSKLRNDGVEHVKPRLLFGNGSAVQHRPSVGSEMERDAPRTSLVHQQRDLFWKKLMELADAGKINVDVQTALYSTFIHVVDSGTGVALRTSKSDGRGSDVTGHLPEAPGRMEPTLNELALHDEGDDWSQQQPQRDHSALSRHRESAGASDAANMPGSIESENFE
eukprot:Opistho-2@56794